MSQTIYGSGEYIWEYQPPAVLNQAAPVQNDWYELLPETRNIRIYGISIGIEDTDESLELRVTINGEVLDPYGTAATHSQGYNGYMSYNGIDRKEYLSLTTTDVMTSRSFMVEGLSVKIEVRKTTANGVGNLVGVAGYAIKKPMR